MSRIAILGNSIIGAKAAECLRQTDSNHQISLISLEPELPYYKHLLADVISAKKKVPEIYYQNDVFYKGRGIEMVLGKKITRLNIKRNRISFEDNSSLDFDILLITDTGPERLPETKGVNKTGVFRLRRLSDIKFIVKDVVLWETVVICAHSLAAVKMALALKNRGVDVLFVFPGSQLLPGLIDRESAQEIHRQLEGSGIRLAGDMSVMEILGDSEVKAVKLKTGKVFAAEAVLWDGLPPDLRIFKDTGIFPENKIEVDAEGRLGLEHVYATGEFCETGADTLFRDYDTYSEEMLACGESLAARICGVETDREPLLPWAHFEVQERDVMLMGRTLGDAGEEQVVWRDEKTGVYRKFFVEDDRLKGAVLIGCCEHKEDILATIKTRSSFSELKEKLGCIEPVNSPSGL